MSEQTANPQSDTTPAPVAVSPKRKRLSKTLPTSRIPFKKQLEIISAIPIAFDKHAGPVGFKEVGEVMGLAEATLLQASAFFGDVGLIKRVEGGKFIPANELQEYGRIRGFSVEKAWLKLGSLFEKSWFGQELLPRLRLKEINETDAVHCLAEASLAEKEHQENLEMCILFLERVGLLGRDAGVLKLGANNTDGAASKEAIPASAPPATPPPPTDSSEIEIEGLEKHSLTLDHKAGRKVVIFAPPTLRANELARLQQWLGFQFIIEEDSPK